MTDLEEHGKRIGSPHQESVHSGSGRVRVKPTREIGLMIQQTHVVFRAGKHVVRERHMCGGPPPVPLPAAGPACGLPSSPQWLQSGVPNGRKRLDSWHPIGAHVAICINAVF